MTVWLDFFLQVFVHALAWCLAVAVVIAPVGYAVLVLFHRWRRASRASGR